MKTTIFPEEIFEALVAENERHRMAVIAITRGWQNRKKLAEAFGMEKVGAPFDQGLVSGALNGKRAPGIARELETFMLNNEGPGLLCNSQTLGRRGDGQAG